MNARKMKRNSENRIKSGSKKKGQVEIFGDQENIWNYARENKKGNKT